MTPARIRLGALIIAFMTMCAGAEWTLAGEPSPRDTNTLHYGAGLGVEKLNPMLKSHGWCEASCMIFNRLYRVSSNGRMEYDLLKQASFSDDLLTFTLELREHVQWHDGAAFTSADVVFTFDVLFDPKTPTDLDKDLMSMRSWRADGTHRVLVEMQRPDPHISGRLSEVPMLPWHLLKGVELGSAAFNEHPIGTGAFAFDRRESRDVLWLTANMRYHEGPPAIERVKLISIAADDARAQAVADGVVDMAHVQGRHLSMLTGLGAEAVRRYQSGAWRGMPINLRNPIFQDIRVRRAIALAIDRQEFVKVAAMGLAKEAFSPLVPGSVETPLQDNPTVNPRVNPAEARALLDEAGWVPGPDGTRVKNGRRLVLRLIVWKDEAFRRIAATVLQKQLAGIGIEVEPHLFDNEGYNRHASNMGDAFDAFIGGWGGLADPTGNIYRKFHSKGSQNHMGYRNAEVDRLIEKALSAEAPERLGLLLTAAWAQVEQDAVFIPLIYPEYAFATSRRIDNLPTGPVDSWYEITKHAYTWRIGR